MFDRVFLSSGGESYWLLLLSGTPSPFISGITIDSQDNIYSAGQLTSSPYAGYMLKLSSTGSILWQRRITNGAPYGYSLDSVTTRSDGKVFAAGYSSYVGGWATDVFRCDPDGSNTAGAGGITKGGYNNTVAADTSGNVYIAGTVDASAGGPGGLDYHLIKYNSSGSVVWQKLLGWTSDEYSTDVQTDSAGNVYLAGVEYNSLGNSKYFSTIAKYNSSGSVLWQKTLYNNSINYVNAGGIAIGSDSSVYVVLGTYIYSNTLLVKLDSSGNIIWQRSISGGSVGSGGESSIAIDAQDNIYISDGGKLLKYNSSGTIQWNRSLALSGTNVSNFKITCVRTKDKYLCLSARFSQSVEKSMVLKLPVDGSLTGTYTISDLTLTYATGAGTDTAGSLSISTAGFGQYNSSATLGGFSTFTPTTPSISATVKTI